MLIAAVVLGVRLPAQTTAAVKAFTGARVIDGTDAAPIDNATMSSATAGWSRSARRRGSRFRPTPTRTSLAGKTVIPGLINAHGHVGDTVGLSAERYSADQVMKDLRTYAVYGVTTVVSLGGDQAPSFAARDSQRTAALDRARICVAGPVLAPESPEEARKLVAEDAAMKVDIVKIRVDDNLGTTPKMPPEIYRAVIDEAHKRGLRVAAHLFYLADAKSLLDAGADFIAHSVRDADVDAPLIAAAERRDVCVCADADARSLDVRLRVGAAVLLRSAVSEVRRPARRSPRSRSRRASRRCEAARQRSATRPRSTSPAAI